MKNKKTVFITIGVGMIARNFLLNRFYQLLREQFEVVVITPIHDDPEFVKRFGGEGVTFVPLQKFKETKLELSLKGLHKALVYNETVKTRAWHGLSFKGKQEATFSKRFKNWLEYLIFGLVLSKIHPLRDMARWFDYKLTTHRCYDNLFTEYQPVGVFVTNICSDDEVQLVRAAKRLGAPTVGMTKSWDNFSKVGVREKTDNILVWSQYMKDEVLAFQNYKDKNVEVVGIPQFDLYCDLKTKKSRQDFINLYGLDPQKKIILFGQEAPIASPDDPYVVKCIKDWIIECALPYQILIRPHFGHRGSIAAFDGLADGETVFIDTLNEPSRFAAGAWDISSAHHERLALSMRYSDIVVTSTSTLVLDAIASDNQVLCYAFDEDKSVPADESMTRFYQTRWFSELRRYGFQVNIVESEDLLMQRIKEILESSSVLQSDMYDKTRERFCYQVDGGSGERIFKALVRNFQSN